MNLQTTIDAVREDGRQRNTQRPVHQATQRALAHARRGWAVFPCEVGGKKPLGRLVPHGLHEATTDPARITSWWNAEPHANIGIATGAASGFFAVDIDTKENGPATWAELTSIHGDPNTATVKTPTGGWHMYFSMPSGVDIRNSAGVLGPGVDVRGSGGYVVAAGSIRPEGTYTWSESSLIAEPPGWLVDLVTKKPERHHREDGGRADGLVGEGRRNSHLVSLAGSMRRRGMTPQAMLAALQVENTERCDPPLPEDEVRTIAVSVGRYEPADDGTTGVHLGDFYAYMPTHSYIFAPSGEMWPASSVNARIAPIPVLNPDRTPALNDKGKPKSIQPSQWLDRHQAVEQMTWVPAMPALVQGRLVSDGGWINRPGCTTFNLYRPPQIALGDASKAGMWTDHVSKVYPDNAEHIIAWLAHRAQRPNEKVNHAIVMGGCQGIGKDTILEPVKHVVGPWNFTDVSPMHMLGRFNGFVKSVILRVSEARDLGDVDRYAFYDHMKTYTRRRRMCSVSMRNTSANTPPGTSAASSSQRITGRTASTCPLMTGGTTSPGAS